MTPTTLISGRCFLSVGKGERVMTAAATSFNRVKIYTPLVIQ